MRANNINGKIELFNTLPSTWNGKKHYMGGFASSPVEVLEEEGFYEVVDPQIDERVEEKGDLYLENNKYYYTIKPKTWSEGLPQLKEKRLNELDSSTRGLLNETDWYYIRQIDRGIEVPQHVEDARAIILNNHNDQSMEILSLTKKADVITYEFK